jgi:hypothetical protein
MPDTHRRELERRFSETGALEDEVALLKARLRDGTLLSQRLRVAGYLRNPASLELLGEDAPGEPPTFGSWATGFEPLGPEVSMRVAIAAARRSWRVAARFFVEGDPGHPLRVLEAAELSVACPCVPHIQELIELARRAQAEVRGPNAIQLGTGPAAAAQACLATALLVDTTPHHPYVRAQRSWWGPEHARLALCDEVADGGDAPSSLTDSLLGEAGERIRHAVRAEVVPWALGHQDPLRLRVHAAGP